MNDDQRAFSFLRLNDRGEKPRSRGVTEIRGLYYDPVGSRYLRDILETIVTRGPDAVEKYLEECRALGFDIVEVSSGFLSIPIDDLVRLTEQVQAAGMKAKPELNIQFGAGGASAVKALEREGTQDPGRAIREAKRHLDAGAYMIRVASEGIIEQVREWRTGTIAQIADELGLDKVMLEATEPAVYEWYIKNFGPEVNLFVDNSQIVHLECLRSGIWGTASLWGRVQTHKG